MAIYHTTAASFGKIVSQGTVLVDFWAPWCAPCMMQGAILEELDKETDGKVTIVKVNIDDEMLLARQCGVLSVPTLVLFRDGEVRDLAIGLQSIEQLRKFIEE